MEDSYTLSLRQTRRAMLSAAIAGYASFPELQLRSVYLYSDKYYLIIADYFKYNENEPEYQLLDIIRTLENAQMSYEILNVQGYNVIVFIGSHALKIINQITEVLGSVNGTPTRLEHGAPLDYYFIAEGGIVNSIAQLKEAFAEALMAYNSRFFVLSPVHALSCQSTKKSAPKKNITLDDAYVDDKIKSMVSNIQLFDKNALNKSLNELAVEMCSAKDEGTVRKLLADIYFGIREQFLNLYNTVNIPFAEYSLAMSKISFSKQLIEIISFLHEQFLIIMNSIGYSSRESIIDDVINYINRNYMKNITLESIAPIFGYNSSYLGKIFNQRTGMRLNTYLDSVRIEHSKELLKKSNIQVYKIAEMVGYRNVDYFHLKFKKFAGCSPLQYKQRENG